MKLDSLSRPLDVWKTHPETASYEVIVNELGRDHERFKITLIKVHPILSATVGFSHRNYQSFSGKTVQQTYDDVELDTSKAFYLLECCRASSQLSTVKDNGAK